MYKVMKVIKVIQISVKGRGRISTLLCFLSWTEAILGLALATTAAVPLTMMSTHMKEIQLDLEAIFKTQLLCGATVTLASYGGALVSRAIAENSSQSSLKRPYFIWTTFCSILIIMVTIVLFALPYAVDAGLNELFYIFQRGMREYLQERRWKSMLDGIQQSYKCCGLESYEDWFKTNWMPVKNIRTDLKSEKSSVSEDGGVLVPILPHSCCIPEVDIPCIHDDLQQNATIEEWDVVGPMPFKDSVYTKGCSTFLQNKIMFGLTSFNIIVVMIIIIQVGVLILTKCLRDSLLMKNEEIKENNEVSEVEAVSAPENL